MQDFFSPLSDFFFAILRFLHEGLGVSWAWSIVLLTVVIRVVLIPLTWRQIKSMRAMQALQPQLKALQEKYRNDRQVLNQKTMEFYRENKVSPFGSCLPLLLQMPVFIGLFYMLRHQGQLNGYVDAGAFATAWHSRPVSWLWIHDITKFDLALMFLYIASQFATSWQMSRKGAGQQKVIAYIMPVIIGVFMFVYKWPAGLFIYWVTSNVWTIAQQFAAEKIMPVHVPVVAASEKEKTSPSRPGGKAAARPPARTPSKTSSKTPTQAGKKGPGGNAAKSPAQPARKPTSNPAGKSGGKSSGKEAAQKGKATGSKGQRPQR
jgi:YidC/Oxa1 family membrane protein insertase